jgi:hypothetical protein
LAIVIRAMTVTPIAIEIGSGARAGTAEAICSTADDVDTATVRL